MSGEDLNDTGLIPSRPTPLARAGAASLVTRGLNDLDEAESAGHWRKKGDECEKCQNYAEAMRWYRMAADDGDALAMNHLGAQYSYGKGVEPDYAEAMRWLRMAADKGEMRAMTHIGAIYYSGRGVKRDLREAMHWFRIPADRGDALAMRNIGHLYLHGEGVPQDDAEAYFLADSRKHKSAA